VHSHLKALEKENLIRREYVKGKILIMVNEKKVPERLNKWLLSQLAGYVSDDTLDEGLNYIDSEAILLSAKMLIHFIRLLIRLFVEKGGWEEKVKSNNWFLPWFAVMNFWRPRSYTGFKGKTETLEDLVPNELEAKQWILWSLQELTPNTFDISVLIYELDKAQNRKDNRYIMLTSNIPSDTVKKFEQAIDWWTRNIRDTLRGGMLIESTLGVCFSTLLDNKQLGNKGITLQERWIATSEDNGEKKSEKQTEFI